MGGSVCREDPCSPGVDREGTRRDRPGGGRAAGREVIPPCPTPAAFGKQEEHGNVEELVFVAERAGDVYQGALEWMQRIRRAAVDEELRPALEAMEDLARHLIERLEAFPDRVIEQVRIALTSPPGTQDVLEIDLHVDEAKAERLIAELDRVRRRRLE